MGYIERIQSDLTAAMKEKDELRLSVLRMVKSALKNKEIEKMRPLDDMESLQILQTLVKQRRESVDQFTRGGRKDLAGPGREVDGDGSEGGVVVRLEHRPGQAADYVLMHTQNQAGVDEIRIQLNGAFQQRNSG